MGQRGRKSAASLEVMARTVERMERLSPPHDITDEETEVWHAVVSAEPADWFSSSSSPLLAQYCRHVVSARRVAETIERLSGGAVALSVEDYDRLLKMQERESRAIASLATKMRVSQQATTNHRGNKKPTISARPWE